MKYDVVVVGGGPAGSVTARFAAEKGAKVLIVERRQEIGVPVLCGEGISRKIDDWGMLEGKRWIASTMEGARIYSPDKTCVTLSADVAGNETGYVVYRDIFDQELARRAVKAGAEIMLNTTATGLIKKDNEIKGVKVKQFNEEFEIQTDIVVGADGVESKVGEWAGINTCLKPTDLETCAQYTLTNVECSDAYCDFYLGKEIAPGGYIWVFPKGKDVANVGIGILASFSESGMAKKLLDKFIESDHRLKKGEPVRFLAGAVPVSLPVETVRDHLVLVGDAARHVDPITGGGLTHCLEGGKIAGEVIGEAVEKQDFTKEILMKYETGWKNAFGGKLKRNYAVKEIMLDMDDKTFNMLADSLKDYKFEELSTYSLIKALVLKHPTLLMKLKPLMKMSKEV
ncbi:MAG: NAD(P)/FAD-dependent oxidoreductase [Thermoplasmata archaeon]|nr:MAG: NAD(P)/FAD-dependent oxidoreductase [Thermoplasmata archaeon]RLF53089.1 MAG: NAD(P)/FAD-dependent oxidoreductase [Thermoplasmata archaeon]